MQRVCCQWFVLSLIASLGLLATSCRDYAPTYHGRRQGGGVSTDEPGKVPPTPPVPLSTTGDEPDRPITSLYVNAGCTVNPESMAVAADHAEATLCESIRITPVIEHDGDVVESAAPVTWSATDWADLSLDCTGNQHDLCTVRMTDDYFGYGGATEPGALVTACIENDCANQDASCEPSVCASVTAYSVVNLEGAWSFDPIGEPPDLELTITQTGRTIFSAQGPLRHAFISGFSVFFDYGDYRYIGVIAPDRAHLEGYALDLISLLPAGTWSAHRL